MVKLFFFGIIRKNSGGFFNFIKYHPQGLIWIRSRVMITALRVNLRPDGRKVLFRKKES